MTRRWMIPMVLLVLTTACKTTFVYKPSGPVAGGPTLPEKLAVLPFADGTVDNGYKYWNLARQGAKNTADSFAPLPPEFWSKALADDLAASRRFGGVRFVYSAAEAADADYVIEGTLLESYVPPGRFALALQTVRSKDRTVVWEGRVERTFSHYDFYELSPMLNDAMRSMFAEVGAELAAVLGGKAKAPGSNPPPGASSPGGDSVDDTIRKILQGK